MFCFFNVSRFESAVFLVYFLALLFANAITGSRLACVWMTAMAVGQMPRQFYGDGGGAWLRGGAVATAQAGARLMLQPLRGLSLRVGRHGWCVGAWRCVQRQIKYVYIVVMVLRKRQFCGSRRPMPWFGIGGFGR